MAGAPQGNKNAAKGTEATKALFQALDIASGNRPESSVLTRYKVLVDMWKPQIAAALEGDRESLKLIVERTDGKPSQSIDMIAEVTARNAKELSDEQLTDIATRSS